MYQPITPISGIAGWRFMQRTQDTQFAAFSNSAELNREVEYFKANINKITSAEDLIKDFSLLKVALGAFGLEDKIADKFFMKKVLEEGTESTTALAMKLTDTRFREFAEAFGFGNAAGSNLQLSDFGTRITEQFKVLQFEKAVGENDSSMRLALTLERDIAALANDSSPDSTAWFLLMGNSPLREVFETTFGLPKSIGQLDIDRQREIFRDANERLFGDSSLAVFKDPENIDKLLRTFFAREQINNGPGPLTAGMSALTLMQNAVAAQISFNRPR